MFWCHCYRIVIPRSPSGETDILFNIISVLNFIFIPNVNIIVTGDFNLDSSKQSRNMNAFRNLVELLSEFNLKPLVGWLTRVTHCTSTIIDHIFSNLTHNSVTAVINNDISDHRTVLFQADYASSSTTSNTFVRRSFKNVGKFKLDLSAEEWEAVYSSNNMNMAYRNFQNIFHYHYDKNFPLLKVYKKYNRKSWVNVRMSSMQLRDLY